ncbi:threonine/serine dehydratase [Streptomyces sp. CBMA123]|uniref:threonine ammonia-lyase n=1 Tax=Streptomyces sp. CBMA123 TaxID=1896313 RepID=UPI001661FB33|nr:threonine/serine dehydratase [Streptomyces sp. CBMA123]MBD0688854.1 pyridoxal-5'-phosphate-dependent protein [Streptomyces sp. CBMA123]
MLISDVTSAAKRISGRVVRTPVITLPELDAAVGARVVLKSELHQHTGAFKIRGALNKLLAADPGSRRQGVVAASSGNFGRAVAMVAQQFGIPAHVVLPGDVPEVKVAAVRAHQAHVVHYDPLRDDRDVITADLADRLGLRVLPSSDDPDVAAGHGTLALELFDQAGALDLLVVPVGGGGLAAGCATVAKALNPRIQVVGVEPADGDDTARSLRAGHRVSIPTPSTIADGLRHRAPGRFTFEVNSRLLDRIDTVTNEQIVAAMEFLWRHGRLMAEPSGACALAALLAHHRGPTGLRIGVVLSGGNIQPDRFHRMLAADTAAKYV